jgi:hypothetical protein
MAFACTYRPTRKAGRPFRFVVPSNGYTFDIPIDPPRSNTNYNARVSGGGVSSQTTYDVSIDGLDLDHFTLVSSGPLSIGDVLMITLEDL